MKVQLLFSLVVISILSYGQIRGVVKDSASNEPIPYVNIWVENEFIGTTSNEKGTFTLNADENCRTIIFSSLGYETKKVNLESIKNEVWLKPKITELKEVIVNVDKQKHETVIGRFKKSKIESFFGCDSTPWMAARFFEFNEKMIRTPYLKTIKIFTQSRIPNSKFNIRFYSVNEKGEPGDYIHDKNFICIAPKGYQVTEIDVSELNIKFPEKGLFIALEWLIIPEHKFEINITMRGVSKKIINYSPTFGNISSETNDNSWFYSQGNWKKVWRDFGPLKRYKAKYNLLAMELILTN